MIHRPFSALALAGLLAGCAVQPAPAVAPASPPAVAPQPELLGLDDPAPDTMRWTYGSGESAAAATQAWHGLVDYALAAAKQDPAQSVLMGLPGSEGGVGTVSCAGKQPAVIFDLDETVILNLGYEYWLSQGHKNSLELFTSWANTGDTQVAPVPGALDGIKRLRAAGIAVIYNTNRPNVATEGTIRQIAAAGLGTAVHGQDLFLAGDDALGFDKNGRRATISARYCVLAMAGDNLGDFASLLNDPALGVQQRRALTAGRFADMWGNGWFLIPNAAYGAWMKGTMGEVFPPAARWEPPAEKPAPAIMSKDK